MLIKSFYIKMLLSFILASTLNVSFATSIPNGEQLYRQKCAACHGNSGDGGVGIPLALPDFQATVSDAYLRKTIKLGRPGRVMPGFPKLTANEINAIVHTIRSFTTVKSPGEVTRRIAGNRAQGKIVYKQHCASCHGTNAQGQKGTGVTFSRPRDNSIMAPALNNSGFLKSATDFMIKQTLLKGRRGTPMPSFKEKGLSDSDINNVVSYIRSFENKTPKKEAEDQSPIISMQSSYSLTETIENIKRAAIGKNFKIIRTQTLDNGFVSKADENSKQTIIYFCNFEFLNQALAIDPRIGMFLPCRVTVVEHKGKVTVKAINPLRLSRLFNNSELDRYCLKMKKMYLDIIEEAVL